MTTTKKYVGYHNESALPFAKGDKVVIPACTVVESMHPQRKEFITTRKMTVTVDHLLPGRSQRIAYMSHKERSYFPQHADKFAAFDALHERMRTLTGEELTAASHEYHNMMLHIDNPTIRWPGAGGYWNGVDINDLLDINGKN